MFASKTLTEHILRGLAGIGALWSAVAIAESHPWGSLALGALVLLAFRGCPICWSIGLFETARQGPWEKPARSDRKIRPDCGGAKNLKALLGTLWPSATRYIL